MNDDENKLSILIPPKESDFRLKKMPVAEVKAEAKSDRIQKKLPFRGLKKSTAVLLGVLLASVVLALIGSEKVALYIESFNRAERQAQAEAQAKLANLKLQQKLNEEQVLRDHLKSEQRQQRLMEQKRQQQLELVTKIKRADQGNAEKQAKWEKFYQKSPVCIDPKEWKQQVACANERMNAEARFEALYQAGKI